MTSVPIQSRTDHIPLFKTYSDAADVEAVTRVILRGTYWAVGPEVEEFERQIAAFIGTRHALTFNSGTSALHTLLLAHGVRGKQVIVPSFTFIATANAVLFAGATPVFAESEDQTLGLDAADVEARITADTRAIIPLHYGGFPSRDIIKLRELTDRHGLLLIDDAAESFGAAICGKKVGTFGHSAIFSFCHNKVISTGEGGVIVTDDRQVFEKAKLIRSHGRVELAEDYFSSIADSDYITPGYNFRMSSLSAALGISQLGKIQTLIDQRRQHAVYLTRHLKQFSAITVPQELPGHHSVYQMYTVQLSEETTRNRLQQHLANDGILSKVYFNPVHLKTIFRREHGYKEGDFPATEALSRHVLNLPLFVNITQAELDRIITSIATFFRHNSI